MKERQSVRNAREKYTKIGEGVCLRGKFLHYEEECIEDYIKSAEEHLQELKELKREGFECAERNSPRDDYHFFYLEHE